MARRALRPIEKLIKARADACRNDDALDCSGWESAEAEYDELRGLLGEWLTTPFFPDREGWQEWIADFRPRVEKALRGEGFT